MVIRGIDDVLSAKKALVEIANFDYQGKPIELFHISVVGASLGRRTKASSRNVIPLRELMPFQGESPGSLIYGPFPEIFQRVRGDAIWDCAEVTALQFDNTARELRPRVSGLNYDLSGPMTPEQERCRQEAARVVKAVPWKEIPEQK